MIKPSALEMEHLSLYGDLGEHEGGGGYLTGDFEEKVSYQGMCRRRLWKWVSLSIGEPGGGGGLFTGNFEK